MSIEPGKLIYKFLFHAQASITKSLVDNNVDIWYRNSLLQDYFSFGKSDIDVTVNLKDDKDFISRAKAIASSLAHLPLVKEINFYYPFSLKIFPYLANQYELKKDPVLASQTSADNRFTEAQKLVYLLRMFFSNLNKREFDKRDVEKWTFHFALTENNSLSSSLAEGMSRKELLRLVLKGYGDSVFQAMWYAVESFWNGKPLYDQYRDCPFQIELYSFLPHQFCFIDPGHQINSVLIEQVFITQLSWELTGMMNQPLLFDANGAGHAHLTNIKKTLDGAKLSDQASEQKKEELRKFTDSFLNFLNLNHL